MSRRKYILVILMILIYACLIQKSLGVFKNNLDPSKVNSFIHALQQRNLLSPPVRQEVKRDFSNPCFGEIYEFINSILKKEPWTLKMLDASSKIPSGILIGNTYDLGMYDECLAIRENKNGSEIRGRHCIYSLELSSELKILKPKLSVCVPSKCNATDVTHLLELLIFNVTDINKIGINSVKTRCSRIDPLDWTFGSILALSVIGMIVYTLLLCTVFDLFQIKMNVQNKVVTTLSRFSIRRSALQILNMRINPASLPTLNGIRFFSICWVVLGHAYLTTLTNVSLVNKVDIFEWITSWHSLYVILSFFAVDSFFALSGFLMAYVFLKEMSKGRKFNLFGYYLHRYIRLTPAMGMMLLLAIFVTPHLGSGPIWENIFEKKNKCDEKWWTFLLYLHNFIKRDVSCLGHLWYLAVDMQLFWFSPIILYPLSKKPKIGLLILAASFIASLATVAAITAVNEFSFNMMGKRSRDLREGSKMFESIYIVPHTRAGPWFVGIFFGYITVSKEIKLNKLTASTGWICALVSFLFCTLGFRYIQRKEYEYNLVWETIYGTTCRSIWALGLLWIIFASIKGYAGPVAKFLSLPILLPLGRISYCVYLVHMLVLKLIGSSVKINIYFSDFETFLYFLSNLTFSIVIAFFFSLFFESPLLTLEKLMFPR